MHGAIFAHPMRRALLPTGLRVKPSLRATLAVRSDHWAARASLIHSRPHHAALHRSAIAHARTHWRVSRWMHAALSKARPITTEILASRTIKSLALASLRTHVALRRRFSWRGSPLLHAGPGASINLNIIHRRPDDKPASRGARLSLGRRSRPCNFRSKCGRRHQQTRNDHHETNVTHNASGFGRKRRPSSGVIDDGPFPYPRNVA
jgi:hypothetical protein